MQPKKYGDRTILAGDKDNPIELTPTSIRVTIVEPLKEDE